MAEKTPQTPIPREKATEEHKRRQYRLAGFAMLATAAFVAVIIGLVTVLGIVAQQQPTFVDTSTDVGVVDRPEEYEPFYVLIIGSDTRKGTTLYTGKDNEQGQVAQYADIMTLMRVDPQTYTITLVSIPRDTVIAGETAKINAALNGDDPQAVVDAVARLTGIEADYYVMSTFATFDQFIDAIGGVDVDVPRTVTFVDPMTADNVTVQAGDNRHLNGAEALVFARARKEYASNQDALRQVNVRSLEKAIIEKVLNLGSELDLHEVLGAFGATTVTNMDLNDISAIALDFMLNKNMVRIYDATGPYEGDNRASDGQWVVTDDSMAWERITALTDSGYDPSGVVEAPTFEDSDPQ